MYDVRNYCTMDFQSNSDDNSTSFSGASMTVQSQKEEADINTIVKNFGVTGQLPTNVRVPTYGDFTGVDDYRTALEAIREAEASFMAMPADIRAKFENDPQQFLEFCEDERNLPEMRKLGLAVPEAVSAENVKTE